MRSRSERGQTAVEFALVIPVMLLFLLGVFQVGRTLFNKESLATATRDGTRAGAIRTGLSKADIIAAVKTSIASNAVGIDKTKITYPAGYPYCGPSGDCVAGDTLYVKVTYPWNIGVMSFSKSGTLTTTTSLRME